jgi:hypothetical protein
MPDEDAATPILTNRDEFFALMGYAIARWAHVDRELFDLCRFALQTTPEETAIVFYRSPNIGDHLTLVDHLIVLSISQESYREWKTIFNSLTSLLPFRNDIAHNPAGGVVEIKGSISIKDGQAGNETAGSRGRININVLVADHERAHEATEKASAI